MKKVANIGYYIFFMLFLLLIAMILIISSVSIAAYRQYMVSLVSLIAVPGFFYLLMALPEGSARWKYPLIASLLGTLFKIICLFRLGGDMVMKYDYLTALESAQGAFAEKELIYAHWAVYPRILSVFMKLFGQGYTKAVWFNILVAAISTWLVYLVCERALRQVRTAYIAALIFALWPSLNFYHLITSNEFLAMLFGLLSIYLVQVAVSKKDWLRYIWFFAAGVSLGLVDFFKQFSIIFYIAFAISALIFYFLSPPKPTSTAFTETGSTTPATRHSQKQILAGLFCFVIMLVTASGCKALVFAGLDRYLGAPVCRSANAHFIYMGLNSTGNGIWNDAVGFDFRNLAEKYDRDYDKASKELFRILKEDLKKNPQKLPLTIRNKLTIDWSADKGVVDWVRALYRGGEEPMPFVNLLYALSGSYYVAVILLMAVGSVWAFRRKNFWVLLFSLIIFGFALILVLTEAQGRYQLVLFPWFAILAANGFSALPVKAKKPV